MVRERGLESQAPQQYAGTDGLAVMGECHRDAKKSHDAEETDQPLRHEVRRQLDLLAHVGIDADDDHLSLHVPDGASRSVRARLEGLGIRSGDPWLLVHPGATASSRRYPPERLGEVLRRLHVRTRWPLILTGSRQERPLIEQVRRAADGLGTSLAGQLTTAEVAALVAVAPLVLTNNSLPAHLAAAVGTPVVDLYALTNIQHTPWGVPNRVLSVDVPCKGCRRSVCPRRSAPSRPAPRAVARRASGTSAGSARGGSSRR